MYWKYYTCISFSNLIWFLGVSEHENLPQFQWGAWLTNGLWRQPISHMPTGRDVCYLHIFTRLRFLKQHWTKIRIFCGILTVIRTGDQFWSIFWHRKFRHRPNPWPYDNDLQRNHRWIPAGQKSPSCEALGSHSISVDRAGAWPDALDALEPWEVLWKWGTDPKSQCFLVVSHHFPIAVSQRNVGKPRFGPLCPSTACSLFNLPFFVGEVHRFQTHPFGSPWINFRGLANSKSSPQMVRIGGSSQYIPAIGMESHRTIQTNTRQHITWFEFQSSFRTQKTIPPLSLTIGKKT